MGNLLQSINKALKNNVLHFVFAGYVTYFIQFVNSLFIAVYLGPYYLGIWGFIMLIIQYANQLNFGISHSINALASVNKHKTGYVSKLLGTAFIILIGLSVFVTIIFALNYLLDLQFGEKYNFSKYAPLILLIAILGYFNGLISNVFRIYGKLFEIAFSQIAFPVLVLASILFFKGESLLWALVIDNVIAFFLSFILFIIQSPVKIRLTFSKRLAIKIQRKGWHLFIYNTSFYLIIISTRSFVSAYYDVTEFGYFTFAFTMANAILLLLEALSYLIYPKMLNRFASYSMNEISSLLEMVRDAYITTSHALIHFSILLFPVFLMHFPKYQNASSAFKIIALTIVLYTNSFGYSGLIIAKNEEKKLGRIAFFALCMNIVIALLLVKVFQVTSTFVIVSTMITYVIYVFSLGVFGRKIMNLKIDILSVFKDVFPFRLFLPYLLSFLFIAFHVRDIYFIIPFLFFLVLNYQAFFNIVDVVKKVVINPEFIKL